jgi:hypothetical protein
MQSSSIQKNMALLKYSCCAAYYTRFRPKPKCITVQLRTWARHLDFCHSCRRCNAAASESVRRDRCPQRLQIYHVEETRDRITERCCSKIKRRHQLVSAAALLLQWTPFSAGHRSQASDGPSRTRRGRCGR